MSLPYLRRGLLLSFEPSQLLIRAENFCKNCSCVNRSGGNIGQGRKLVNASRGLKMFDVR